MAAWLLHRPDMRITVRISRSLLAATFLVVLGPSAMAETLFDKPQVWTRDVSGSDVSARSDAIIQTLSESGGWGNSNRFQIDFGMVLLEADAQTPRQKITKSPDGYCYDGPDCDPVPLTMPLPSNGATEGSPDYTCDIDNNDCHVLVVDRAEAKLFELYRATAHSDDFTAYGAFIWDLTRQYSETLRGDQCTSADAAGLPIAPLVATADEVASGVVPHALRFILPNDRIKAGVYVRPATHAGAPENKNENAPAYGVRFRLKQSFDESSYLGPGRVVLRALKTYGMILADGGEIALTFADDRFSKAKWSDLGIESRTFASIPVTEFEVVELGPEIPLTYECAREP